LVRKYPDDARVRDGAVNYRGLITAQIVDCHLHLASAAMVDTSHKEAMKQVNAALALDPENQRALAQRARIEVAANEGIGFDLFD